MDGGRFGACRGDRAPLPTPPDADSQEVARTTDGATATVGTALARKGQGLASRVGRPQALQAASTFACQDDPQPARFLDATRMRFAPTVPSFARPAGATGPAALAAFVTLLAALAGCGKTEAPRAAPTPPQVGVFEVAPQRLPIDTELPGRTSPRMVAEIRPQVGGIVQRRLFEEGAQVKAGQVLYQIDAASFEAAFASAQANVAKAEATLGSARVTARRNAELVKIDAISQQQSDDSEAALKQAQADLALARAQWQTARIDLERTRITAPIAGVVDLSTVTPGALVTANQTTALTTVRQLDPLYVDVVQSSAELLRLKSDLASGALQRSQPVRASAPAGSRAPARATPGATPPPTPSADEAPIRLLLEDGSAYAHAGVLKVSGATVNPSTGAITLRALVPNPDGLLIPGMYVRAVLQQGVIEDALLVPQQGITRTPSGAATALVVNGENKVERRNVVVDRAIGDRWQVTRGLGAGDRVIVEGVQRAKVGQTVTAVAQAPAAPGSGASSPLPPGSRVDAQATGAATAAAPREDAPTAPALNAPAPSTERQPVAAVAAR